MRHVKMNNIYGVFLTFKFEQKFDNRLILPDDIVCQLISWHVEMEMTNNSHSVSIIRTCLLRI